MDVYAPQTWLPHERPMLPGSPSTLFHAAPRRAAYLLVGFIVALTGGLGNALVTGALLIEHNRASPLLNISFSLMFTIAQNLGGLFGSALVNTFQVVREKYHSSQLVEHLTLLDPLVAARVQGGAATREANILAWHDVFLAIGMVAVATITWMLCTTCKPAPDAQAGMAKVALTNSGSS